ncbi:MAG: hypothetical protein Q4P33_09680, partial [Flaviflexus sp.]|nr:hypothetical protein [Flaviflexus sp.]
MNRRIFACLGALTLLVACSNQTDSPPAPDSSTGQSSAQGDGQMDGQGESEAAGDADGDPADGGNTGAQEETGGAEETGQATAEPSPAPREDPNFDPATCTAPVPGAYPCAGRPIPVAAKEITTVSDYGVATLVMPSGNIGCDVFLNGATCVVESWPTSVNPNYDPGRGGYVTASVGQEGPAQLGQGTDTPGFRGGAGSPAGQVLPYGTVWYFGDYVFSSQQSGLTFWNAATGSGA